MTGRTVPIYDRLASGVDPTADAEYRLCTALGLNVNEVAEVYIEIQPGRGAAARWTSVRKVDLERIAQALEPAPEPVSPWDEQPCGAVCSSAITPPCTRDPDHDPPHRNVEGVNWHDSSSG